MNALAPRVLLTLCLAGSGSVALAAAPATAAPADPPGNNGTIAIAGVPLDGGRGNEPHVGCTFALRFFGFDAGQTADVSFTAQAPTDGDTLLEQQAVQVSDDAAGGGQDEDAVLTYTAEQLGLVGTEAHPQQGWHVKVAVDALEAPGGPKQKVFWISCPAAPEDSTESSGSATGTTTGMTTDTSTPTTGTATSSAVGSTTGSATATTPEAPSEELTLGSGTVAAELATSSGGAKTFTAPAAGGGLPFTGAPLSALVPAGLAATALGGLTVVAARRRRAPSEA